MMIRNWRDQIPYIGHESKIIWPLFNRADPDNPEAPEHACLIALGGFTRHIVQGRITAAGAMAFAPVPRRYPACRVTGSSVPGSSVARPIREPTQAAGEPDAHRWRQHNRQLRIADVHGMFGPGALVAQP